MPDASNFAPHVLIIERIEEADLYVAAFKDTATPKDVMVAVLLMSLADLDNGGTILNNWRTFLEDLFTGCMVDLTGYPREAIVLQRDGLITRALLKESA
jgi:hypothetical protein